MNENIDQIVSRYQECALHIRFSCFPTTDNSNDTWDVIDDFMEVNRVLFQRAVLCPLGIEVPLEDVFRKPIPQIIIEPRQGTGIELLVNRPSNDRCNYWDAFKGRVGQGEVTMVFLDWFDWNSTDSPIHQYCMAIILTFTGHPEFEGRKALVHSRDVAYLTPCPP